MVYDHGAGEPSAETSGTAAGLPASAKGCTNAPVPGVIGVNMAAGVWAGVCSADIGVSVPDGPKSWACADGSGVIVSTAAAAAAAGVGAAEVTVILAASCCRLTSDRK